MAALSTHVLDGEWEGKIELQGTEYAYGLTIKTAGVHHYTFTGSHVAGAERETVSGTWTPSTQTASFHDGDTVCSGVLSKDEQTIEGVVYDNGSAQPGSFSVTRKAAHTPAPPAQEEAAAWDYELERLLKADDVEGFMTLAREHDVDVVNAQVSIHGSGGIRGGDGSLGNTTGTYLHNAVMNLRPGMVAMLLEAGADPTATANAAVGGGCMKTFLRGADCWCIIGGIQYHMGIAFPNGDIAEMHPTFAEVLALLSSHASDGNHTCDVCCWRAGHRSGTYDPEQGLTLSDPPPSSSSSS